MAKEYIDRDAAKTAMMQQYKSYDEYDKGRAILYAINTISKMPTADVAQVVHGRWIEQEDGLGGSYYDCSACGESWTTFDGTPSENNMNYCPKCGAKMDLEDP